MARRVIEASSDARNWAMLAHLASFAEYTAVPLANVLGPLVVWLIKKDEMPFVDDQGKEAINFQIYDHDLSDWYAHR